MDARSAPAHDKCRRLRFKGMFIDAEPDLTIPNTSDGMFWCTHTMNCLGPDGRIAQPRHCDPTRACFEPT
jgi:hypothetical protein